MSRGPLRAKPSEKDFGSTRSLDSCLRRNDTSLSSSGLTCYEFLIPTKSEIQHSIVVEEISGGGGWNKPKEKGDSMKKSNMLA